jgi:hypothetical protein
MQPLFVNWSAAVLGGLVGTLAMTAFWYACRAAGWMKLDWGQLLGTFFLPPGRLALAVGLTWHFLTGLVFGAVYAWILVASGVAPTWGPAMALGVLHAAVALAMLYPLTRMHPALPERRMTALWSGRDLALYAIGFPIFGAFFGTTYHTYDAWTSASNMEPTTFWTSAFAIVAIAIVIGLASYRLIPRWREEQSPVFLAAHPNFDERRQAVEAAFREGRMTRVDYEEALTAIDLDERDDREAHTSTHDQGPFS